MTVGAADEKRKGGRSRVALAGDRRGDVFTGEVFSTFVESNEMGAGGGRFQEERGFEVLTLCAAGVSGRLAYGENGTAEAKRPAGKLGAFTVLFEQVAFRAGAHFADRGDYEPHGDLSVRRRL